MGDPYGYPERRKNKNDKKRKRRQGVYKKGGKYRSAKVEDTTSKGKEKKKK